MKPENQLMPQITRAGFLGIMGATLVGGVAHANVQAKAKPATFVLVHGAWHGGWCWTRVTSILTSRGHTVFTPTLTGLGERSHLTSPQIDLSTHIQDIVNVIRWERLTDIILCGHSYGGMVISGVSEKVAPGVIGSIVFLDAFLPDNGKALIDYVGAMAGSDQTGPVKPPPAAAFQVNAADRAWVDAECTPQPFRTLTEKIALTGSRERIARKTYIKATGWDGLAELGQKAKSDPAWHYSEVACGHDVMIDAPQMLAGLLEKAAL